MPKRKGSKVAAYRRKKVAKPKLKPNPPLGEDITEFIIPGFVAYAGTRFLARVVQKIASKRWPNGGRHIAAASSVAAAGGAWFLVHQFDKTERYHTPAVVGASIAAAQTVVQTYLPKYGWMIGDLESPTQTAAKSTAKQVESSSPAQLPSAESEADDFSDIDFGGGSLASGAMTDDQIDKLLLETGD